MPAIGWAARVASIAGRTSLPLLSTTSHAARAEVPERVGRGRLTHDQHRDAAVEVGNGGSVMLVEVDHHHLRGPWPRLDAMRGRPVDPCEERIEGEGGGRHER